MKYHILTFGCQMNVADSGWLDRSLTSMGYEKTPDEDQADFFIVNTCSVREKPEQKVYSLLGRLKEFQEKKPWVFACVGGCVAQQVGNFFFQRFPFVRLVFGTDGLAMVPAALQRLEKDEHLKISLLDFQDLYPERTNHWPDKLGPQAFVNIMQGCDNFCAYCIVPYTRGRQKSRSSAEILRECRELVDRGVKEITLLGQNVNSYGQDKDGQEISFARLLREVDRINDLKRLRFTTSHPKDMSPEVIKVFGELETLCPQLHLPLQSGSDDILKSMGRKYTSSKYLDLVEALRSVCPDLALTTDLIVGFPGETDTDFQQTLNVMNKVGFDSCFSFKYSDRPGVRSSLMQPKVSEQEKTLRLDILQQLQEEWTRKRLESRVGRKDLVLIEAPSKMQKAGTRSWKGRDLGGRVVNVGLDSSDDLTGKILEVAVIRAKKHSLEGEVIR
ncbi:tRNA (N6-isopentenyl adenosine(37)-C2)-methylthiotransferase MiaB [Desulfonatronovibrio hydrogenovorans]|uniref:tRNA (N6-isopentenyl adenosine(37)-C2)-methylthiotransferase MiaB n=1 Tax=Desulfonatronovibrio hydrogenovorans TaxID=53245 RepID=UPI00048CD6B2|nr:tRNA (N6-isopentenyl adenosine(37)-C2)-methylthiotransferase MiaB [Desulfonatronovibrio hydrogenovorans]